MEPFLIHRATRRLSFSRSRNKSILLEISRLLSTLEKWDRWVSFSEWDSHRELSAVAKYEMTAQSVFKKNTIANIGIHPTEQEYPF